jgi:membrane protease YdiL (CAAX protease family)
MIKKVLYFPITRIIAGIAICFTILVGVQNFIAKPIFHALVPSKEIADTLIHYLSVVVLLLSYQMLFRIYEKRKITELSLKYLPKEFTGGLISGFSTLSLVVLILYILGYYRASGISNYSYLLAPLSFLVAAALLEEVVFRLIIYRILEQWIGTYWALIISAIIFMAPHLFNNNISALSVLFLFLFGFAHGTMYNYTKRLWLPFAFHLGWNFAQPFYGSNLSGIQDMESIVKGTFKGPLLLTGSAFGMEDSLLSIGLLVIISVVFLHYSIKKGKII